MKLFKYRNLIFIITSLIVLKPNTLLSQNAGGFNNSLKVFNNVNTKQMLVAAHRGDWRNAPENSLQGLKNAIVMGVDIVELDKENKRRAIDCDARQND